MATYAEKSADDLLQCLSKDIKTVSTTCWDDTYHKQQPTFKLPDISVDRTEI